jgi:hypothetical protein
MDHSYFRDKISAYFDNELSPPEKEVIEQHLAQCQECQDLLAQLRQLEEVVEKKSQLAGEEYWQQAAQRIEQRLGFSGKTKVTDVTPSRWKSLVPKLAAVAASVAVLGFIALYQRELSKDVGVQAPQTPPPEAVYRHDTADFLKKQSQPPSEETLSQKYDAKITSKQTAQELEKSKLPPEMAVSGQPIEKSNVIQQGAKQPVKKVAEPTASGVEREVEKKAESSPTPGIVELAGQAAIKRVTSDHDSTLIAMQPVTTIQDLLEHPETVAQAAKAQPAEESAAQPKIQATGAASGEVTHVVVQAPVLPPGWLEPAGLERWRQRRDSLETLYAELISPHRLMSQAKARRDTTLPAPAQVEQLLLHSQYQVARLTQDENERAIALSFLSAYVQKSDARFREQAEKYLEELQKQQK